MLVGLALARTRYSVWRKSAYRTGESYLLAGLSGIVRGGSEDTGLLSDSVHRTISDARSRELGRAEVSCERIKEGVYRISDSLGRSSESLVRAEGNLDSIERAIGDLEGDGGDIRS